MSSSCAASRSIAPVETLQPQYSLIERDVEAEILAYCEEQGLGVIVYSPMGSGLLTGRMTRERIEAFPDDDWRRGDPRFQEPLLTRNLELVSGSPPSAAATRSSPARWRSRGRSGNPAVDGAIVGFRRPDQVDPIVPAAPSSSTATMSPRSKVGGR